MNEKADNRPNRIFAWFKSCLLLKETELFYLVLRCYVVVEEPPRYLYLAIISVTQSISRKVGKFSRKSI